MSSAFTIGYKNVMNKLLTEIEIIYNDASMKTVALWDTGATNCCISKEVVNELSLIATGKIGMQTPNGQSEANTYLVDINLPNDVKINDVQVADSEIGLQKIGMLIGMNIINQGDLAISHYNSKTVFTFRMPSEHTTDYVKQIQFKNVIGKPHGKGKRKHKKR